MVRGRGAVALSSQFEPYEPRLSAKSEIPLCRDTTSIASPLTRIGTDDATAPRSVRRGGWFRGSRACSLRSPARDPRLLYRPLRGRGPVCLSESQARGISTLTGNTVAQALQKLRSHFHVDRKHRCSDVSEPTTCDSVYRSVTGARSPATYDWTMVQWFASPVFDRLTPYSQATPRTE